jgi:hypothetical protein
VNREGGDRINRINKIWVSSGSCRIGQILSSYQLPVVEMKKLSGDDRVISTSGPRQPYMLAGVTFRTPIASDGGCAVSIFAAHRE